VKPAYLPGVELDQEGDVYTEVQDRGEDRFPPPDLVTGALGKPTVEDGQVRADPTGHLVGEVVKVVPGLGHRGTAIPATTERRTMARNQGRRGRRSVTASPFRRPSPSTRI
jgi:hypothetical protein